VSIGVGVWKCSRLVGYAVLLNRSVASYLICAKGQLKTYYEAFGADTVFGKCELYPALW